ncbi:MAG: PQQ-binding-like beta-propeller repeat protein [Phycisphaerae bacterium]|nr:PQQ-binding-like beta-propeller repeat protein [Phycisphaerae bacterium]
MKHHREDPAMNTRFASLVALLIAATIAGAAAGEDWPQWKGPNRDNRSIETGLLDTWPDGGPEKLWTSPANLGKGYSTVAVADGMIYTTGIVGRDEYLFALDTKGALQWKKTYGPGWTRSHGGARTTPTVDGTWVYVISGHAVVARYNAKTGRRDWSVDAMKRFDGRNVAWGIAESPLIVDDKVICTPGGPRATMAALDTSNGKTRWVTRELSDKSAYCSPRLIEHRGKQIIVTATHRHIVGVDAETGDLLWKHGYRGQCSAHPNTPLYSDGSVYFTSGYNAGGVMLKLAPRGDAVEPAWTDKTLDTHHGSVVRVGEHIYGSSWHGNGNGNWVCLDWDTGEPAYDTHWHNKGSITYADGKLYCYEERSGNLALVEATPKGFNVISSFRITEGDGKHWAHPVIANGRLYIRHGKALMCFDVRGADFNPDGKGADATDAARHKDRPTEDEIEDVTRSVDESRADAKLKLARSYLKMGMTRKAAELLRSILADFPDTAASDAAKAELEKLK